MYKTVVGHQLYIHLLRMQHHLILTNHKDHPTNKAYKVFFFYKEEQSEYFKEMLDKNNIFYEFGIDENNQRKVFLFGIRKSDNAQVLEINYTTLGKFRDPFIRQKWAQYTVILLGIIIIIFSVFSYFKNQ